MSYKTIDCQGFGGAFSCGATLAGFQLVAKREKPGGFGVPLMEANRAFLGGAWDTQACDPEKWDVTRADVVTGTPPCSAFSAMTAGYSAHGMDSSINECMWDLIRFAARVRPAAVIMESVSQAFTNGQVLMHRLAAELNARARLSYRTTHVIQDNYSLGGCTRRKRYFLVLSQVPFGVEAPELRWLPTLGDAIGDLRELPVSWDPQKITAPPSWWSYHLRADDSAVDGHGLMLNSYTRRQESLTERDVTWLEGEKEADVLRKYYELYGELPEEFRYQGAGKHSHLTRDKVLIDRGLDPGGFSQPRCWAWDEPGRVLNGAGPYMVWHKDGRLFTNREAARVMGFPDAWRCGSLRDDKHLHSYWGKGTSVHPAQWVMTWLRESLDGSPGTVTGVPQADGSVLIDVSRNWQDARRRIDAPPPASFSLPAPVHHLEPIPASRLTPVARARVKVTVRGKPVTPASTAWKVDVPAGFRYRPEDEFCVREVFSQRAYRKLSIRPGDAVLDLGAHIGSFAVWALSQGAGHVTAVEMMPESLELLRANTTGLPVKIIAGAVTSESNGTVMAMLSNRGNHMGAFVDGTRKEAAGAGYTATRVDSVSLESLLTVFHPTLVKFDIEGSEGPVLTPAAAHLPSLGIRELIGELHVQDARLLELARDLHAALTMAGYSPSREAPVKPSGWGTVIHYRLPVLGETVPVDGPAAEMVRLPFF
jgi:FkbM family methyltransferase